MPCERRLDLSTAGSLAGTTRSASCKFPTSWAPAFASCLSQWARPARAAATPARLNTSSMSLLEPAAGNRGGAPPALPAGDYVYLPSEQDFRFSDAAAGTQLLIFQKRFEP